MSQDLGDMIKAVMQEQTLSLRKLSECCGIAPSTVSRILNGKQPANIGHLQAFSSYLDIPLWKLLEASGLDIGENNNENSKMILSVIHQILNSYEIAYDDVIRDIQKDLKKCEHYAKTSAGKELVQNVFLSKMQSLNAEGVIIEYLQKLYQMYLSEQMQPHIQAAAGSALLYLISTPDVIPDYAFPIGYLDDAIAVVLTVSRIEDEFNIKLS